MPSRIHKLLSRIVDIKPEEVHISVLLFTFFFLITAPHTIIKALRYADLLTSIGFQEGLPKAYLFTALVSGFVVFLHSKIQFKVSLRVLITSSLVFFAVTGLFFWFFIDYGSRSMTYMFWIWASILVVVLITHFGLTINEIFHPQEAKRLIGFCGSGGILGGTFGGLAGHLLVKSGLGTALLPLASGMLFVCIFVVRAIFSLHMKRRPFSQGFLKKTKQSQEVGFIDSFNAVRKNRYLVFIALMVVSFVIVSTFIDYQFSSIVQDRFRMEIEKQSFLTLFFGLLTLAAFFFQIFLTSPILKRTKGILFTLMLIPLILMMGSFGILIGGISLFTVLIVKSSDDGLAISLNQSVREILYIPVSTDLRYKARLFIDLFVKGVAKVIAAGLLFLYGLYLNIINYDTSFLQGVSLKQEPTVAQSLSWGVIIATLLWILVNFRIFRHYVGTIKQKIQRRWSRVDKDIAGKIDIHYAKQIFDTLESKERSPSLYAMHLFELLEQGKLTPEIRKMISEKVEGVNLSYTQNLFNAEGASWFPEIEDDYGLDSFIADIKEIVALEEYQKLVETHVEKERKQGEETEIKRMELAKAIGMMEPDAPLVKKLEDLIEDDSPQVTRYAIESAAKLQKEEYIPSIIEKLDLPQIREDAVSALLKYGYPAQCVLGKLLKKNSTNIELKKIIIAVLARMGTQESADILLNELDLGSDKITTDLVEALDQIRSENPEVRFSESISKRKTYALVNKYCRTFLELNCLDTKNNEKLQKSLQRTLELCFADIFKLLGFYHPRDDIVRAYQNFKTGKNDSKDYAVELLDNTLKKDIREIILPLIVDIFPAARVQKFQQMLEKIPEFKK